MRVTQVKPEIKIAFEAKLKECHAICQKHSPDREIPLPKIVFARLGTCAGRCSATKAIFWINSDYFADYYNEQLNKTVPHEFAHYVNIFLNGIEREYYTRRTQVGYVRKLRQIHHGDKWREVMNWLGMPWADRCHTFDSSKAKLRHVEKPFRYKCGCQGVNHDVTAKIHVNQQTKNGYKCKKCRCGITFVGTIFNGVFQPKGTPNTPVARVPVFNLAAPVVVKPKVVIPESKFKTITKFIDGVLVNERIPL